MAFVGVSQSPRGGLESRLTGALTSYVRNAYVDEVVETEEGKRFASIGGVRPLFIFDDEKGKGRLHWQIAPKFTVLELTLREGKLGFDFEKLAKSEGPLHKAFSEDFLRTESAMLRSMEDYLVRIDLVRNAMSPIAKLVSLVRQDGRVRPEDLRHKKGIAKAKEYCEFLVSLGILQKENGHYTEGQRFNQGDVGEMPNTELYWRIMTEVYKQGYDYMRTRLHLTGVVPYLNLSHSYYRPTYDYGELVPISNEQLWYWFKSFYDKVPPPATRSYRIQVASQAGIINCEKRKGLIVGNSEIFDRFQKALS